MANPVISLQGQDEAQGAPPCSPDESPVRARQLAQRRGAQGTRLKPGQKAGPGKKTYPAMFSRQDRFDFK